MTPCNPSKPCPQCRRCVRYRPDLPADPERRPLTVCIDASALRCVGHCAMFAAFGRPA